jgi:ABC-type transport system involved in cytochrome c biogenesis permease subunit
MEIKYNLQGYLVYITMSLYVLAFLATVARQRNFGRVLYVAGFLAGAVAFGYRWQHVNHIPLQNMFEVFLCLGMLLPPISLFCRRVLQIGAEGADMLIGVIILFCAGFIFHSEPQHLPPALQSWLFAPHVAVYMLSYVLMAKAAVQAMGQLIKPSGPANPDLVGFEPATYRMICFGFPFLTLGLILGSYWAKYSWGDFWGWDPKELWSLVSWLVYLGYFHFRYMFGKKHAWINSTVALLGLLAIIITLLWVNLSRLFSGMHSYAT